MKTILLRLLVFCGLSIPLIFFAQSLDLNEGYSSTQVVLDESDTIAIPEESIPEIPIPDAEVKDSFLLIDYGCIIIDCVPVYPGGYEALSADLMDNVEYPGTAIEDSIQGTVYLEIEFDQKCRISEVQVFKSVRDDLDSACIQGILKINQKWDCPCEDIKYLRNCIMPIRFSLVQNDNNRSINPLPSNKATNIATEVNQKPGFSKKHIDAPFNKTTNKTGVENKLKVLGSSQIAVFPNPTTDIANIRLKNWSGKEVDISVFTLSGQLLKVIKINEAHYEMSVSELPAGTYIIKVVDGKKNYIEKLIIQ